MSAIIETSALLERDAELEAIARVVEGARAGSGRALLLEGPPGIGKSELMTSARTMAKQGRFTVLAARGAELERDFAFGVVRQLFEAPVAAASPAEREALFDGAAARSASVLGATDGDDVTGEDAFAVIHGLYWLTANLAETGALLIAVDDAHWADGPSLRFLAYLAPRLEGTPVAVVLAARGHEPGAEQRLLDAISGSELATALRPDPLSGEASRELVRGAFAREVEAAYATACFEATGGNPLLLVELLRTAAAEGIEPSAETAERIGELGPSTVSRLALARMARIGRAATALARAAVVLGPDAELSHAAALAEIPRDEAVEAASALSRASVLRGDVRLRFVHPIVAAAIAAEIPPVEMEALHSRAAAILADAGAPAERIAAHLLSVEPARDPAVARRLQEAAADAAARRALDAAVTYFRRALREPPARAERPAILYELGIAEVEIGDSHGAAHLLEAIEATEPPVERARAAIRAAATVTQTGAIAEGIAIGEAGLLEAAELDPEVRNRLEAEVIATAWIAASTAAAGSERFATLRKDERSSCWMLLNAATGLMREGRSADRAVELIHEAFGDPRLFEEPTILMPWAATVLAAADDLKTAGALSSGMVHLGRERGITAITAFGLLGRGVVSHRLGQLRDAEENLLLALELAVPGKERGLPWMLTWLIDVLLDRGKPQQARQIDADAELPHLLWDDTGSAHLVESRGRLLAAEGKPAEALECLLDAGRRWQALGIASPGMAAWTTEAALAYGRLGERDQGLELADRAVRQGEAWGTPRTRALALRAAGVLTGGESGLSLLHQAVAAVEGTTLRLEHAKALVELGAALRRANMRSAGRERLRTGLDLATRCGAMALAERAREELVATGARPRRLVLSGVDSLTPSERRVARLAAEGKRNKQIAQDLFVTERTVETHMRHVLQKLDIESRRALPEALAEAGRQR